MPFREPTETRFVVVLNDEEHYSIWAAGRDLPDGWRAEGFEGTRTECLAHIESAWTDVLPRSPRSAMTGE
jgi:MbtH protein